MLPSYPASPVHLDQVQPTLLYRPHYNYRLGCPIRRTPPNKLPCRSGTKGPAHCRSARDETSTRQCGASLTAICSLTNAWTRSCSWASSTRRTSCPHRVAQPRGYATALCQRRFRQEWQRAWEHLQLAQSTLLLLLPRPALPFPIPLPIPLSSTLPLAHPSPTQESLPQPSQKRLSVFYLDFTSRIWLTCRSQFDGQLCKVGQLRAHAPAE